MADDQKPDRSMGVVMRWVFGLLERKDLRYYDAGRNKRNIVLSNKAHERLGVHALMWGVDASLLVDMLIMAGLNQYVVSDRSGARHVRESAIQADEVNNSVENSAGEASGEVQEATTAPAGEGGSTLRAGGRKNRGRAQAERADVAGVS